MSDINPLPASIHRPDFSSFSVGKTHASTVGVDNADTQRAVLHVALQVKHWALAGWHCHAAELSCGNEEPDSNKFNQMLEDFALSKEVFYFNSSWWRSNMSTATSSEMMWRSDVYITLLFICGVQLVNCIWTFDSLLPSVQCYWICKYVYACISYFYNYIFLKIFLFCFYIFIFHALCAYINPNNCVQQWIVNWCLTVLHQHFIIQHSCM